MGATFTNNSRGRNSKRLNLNSEINVTPFVDVMLVLLIIFMVTSPMLVSGVQVDLPQTQAMPLAGQDEPLVVTIKKDGEIYIGEDAIKADQLSHKLQAVLQEKKETRIFVRGDKNIDYGKVMEVFMSIRTSGYSNVALVTENLEM
jgi:biopolymer transport protein TolR